MIARILDLAIDRRRLVVAAWLVAAALAGWFAVRLELDALPDLTNRQVQILTRAPGLTPEEVELRVTRPIEIALGGLPGLADHRSVSRYGLSAITAIFDDATDLFRARQVVAERLAGVELPEGALAPELGPMSGGLGEIFHLMLTSPRRTAAELLVLAEQRITPALRAVPGVVEVNTWGGARRTFEIRVDAVRLAPTHLTLDQIREAVRRATGAVPGASVAEGERQVLLRGVARPRVTGDLGAVVLGRRADGSAIRLADVADLREGALTRIGAATANGRGETVYVMAQMILGGNAREITREVRRRVGALVAGLPPDVRVDVVYDRSRLVDGTLDTVAHNLAEGGILVVVVLLLMLGSLRAGLVVALTIPLAMLGATAAMFGLGVPGNLMSLGAIDFGLIVDGAVVLVERVFHELAGHPNLPPSERLARVRAACHHVGRPMFASVLVIMMVYVPVLTMTGVDGKLFRPMAITVVLALATSLLAALTLTPALAALILDGRAVPRRPPLPVRLLERGYGALLPWLTRLRGPIAALAVLAIAAAGALFARAGSELTPQLDEGDLVVQTTRRPDISMEAAVEAAGRLEAALLEAPEVRQVVSRIGSPAVATDVMGLEQADVFVGLAPRGRWRPGLTRDALIEDLRARIERASPGADPSFTQPIQMRFNELLAGAPSDVVVSVFGDELATLRQVADGLAAAVAAEPGVVDARVLAPEDVPLVEVEPRPLDAAARGLGAGDVLDAVQAVRFGLPVTTTYDGPLPVPVVLTLGGRGADDGAAGLGGLLVPTPGVPAPLADLATVAPRETPGMVQHERGQRRLAVGFNVRGVDLGTAVAGAQRRAAAVRLPRGYELRWGGQLETLEAAHRRLRVVVPLVLLVIATILELTFRRLRLTLIILTHVPFACVGGVAALALRGLPVSMSAAIGFIALSGIAVMNGVVLLSQVKANEEAGMTPSEAVAAGARERARPVLMTALVAALGFVPMMLSSGVGAEVQRPLATVVVGGLVSSTLLTLAILPAVYPLLAGAARRRRARAAADGPPGTPDHP